MCKLNHHHLPNKRLFHLAKWKKGIFANRKQFYSFFLSSCLILSKLTDMRQHVFPLFFKKLSDSCFLKKVELKTSFFKICQALSSFVELCRALPSFIKLCRALSSFVKLCQALSSFAKLCQALSSFVNLWQALSSFFKLYVVLSRLIKFG